MITIKQYHCNNKLIRIWYASTMSECLKKFGLVERKKRITRLEECNLKLEAKNVPCKLLNK